MFTQIIVNKGVKQFKKQAVAAIGEDHRQLNDMNPFGRVSPKHLTPKQK